MYFLPFPIWSSLETWGKTLSRNAHSTLIHNEITDHKLVCEITYPTKQKYCGRNPHLTPQTYGRMVRNVNNRIDSWNQAYEIDNQE